MKKILLTITSITILNICVNGQCEPVNSIYETFSTTVDDPPSMCWTEYDPLGMAYNTGAMRIFGAVNGDPAGVVILPEVTNTNGILTFIAREDPSFFALPGDGIEIGVMSTFGAEPQFTITYGPNYANYSFDFSSYSGTGNRIYFRRIGEDQKGVEIDNISYTSACISSSATAITQDISIDLDEEGNATLLPALVDDGSYSDCGNHTLSLDKTIFNCENIGVNTLVFTITDNQGNTKNQ